MRLEGLQPGSVVRGILSDTNVTVESLKCHGSDFANLIYRTSAVRVGERSVFREEGRPWSFDGEGALLECRPLRFLEMKDFAVGAKTLTITKSAILFIMNKEPDDDILALVEPQAGAVQRVCYFGRPLERSGITADFDEASVDYRFAEFLSRAEESR